MCQCVCVPAVYFLGQCVCVAACILFGSMRVRFCLYWVCYSCQCACVPACMLFRSMRVRACLYVIRVDACSCLPVCYSGQCVCVPACTFFRSMRVRACFYLFGLTEVRTLFTPMWYGRKRFRTQTRGADHLTTLYEYFKKACIRCTSSLIFDWWFGYNCSGYNIKRIQKIYVKSQSAEMYLYPVFGYF